MTFPCHCVCSSVSEAQLLNQVDDISEIFSQQDDAADAAAELGQ